MINIVGRPARLGAPRSGRWDDSASAAGEVDGAWRGSHGGLVRGGLGARLGSTSKAT